ncbi:pyocin knob domain-containing protein [Paenibacillus sp. FSL E2-8871]|uniref:pyocin knob domain-containing protein n=1 Tax=Paenibacillus sp. FSL E2-8871 TaxID=2975326 RepID=UPI0030FAA741
MAYNKQQWKDEIPDLTKPIRDSLGKQKTDPQTGRPLYELVQEGTRLTAQRLNHIEDGIETVHELSDQNAADIDAHKKDTIKHITVAERSEWKAKETPAGAQTKADAALSAAKTYADTALLAKADKSSTYSKTETDQRIQAVVGAAPDALDTLKEIGDALNNDPNFAATVTNQLSGKVDKVSGKQLSTEDYSSAEKAKLAGLTPGAGAAGSATDATIGNRTADPSITTPYSLTGTITQWFSWITKYFKAITGKANPFDAPDITLAATKTHVDNTVVHVTSAERTAWNAAETNAKNASIPKTDKGAANGVAGLDANVKVPDAQIPSNIARKAVEIPASADLNTYTSEGEYYQGTSSIAATIANKPASAAFYLRVSRHNGVNQWFITFGIPGTGEMIIYTRNVYQGVWGAWEELETSRKKNIANGYAGLDSNIKVARANTYNSLGGASTTPVVDLNLALTAGVYPISPVTLNKPDASMWGQVMVIVSGGETHVDASMWTWQILLQSSGGSYVRRKDATNPWSAWVPMWTGYNDAPLFKVRGRVIGDYNTYTTNGTYEAFGDVVTNNPPTGAYGVLNVFAPSTGYIVQEYVSVVNGDRFVRARTDTGLQWTPWVSVITSGGGIMTEALTRNYDGKMYKYHNLVGYTTSGVTTGTVKITLPKTWSNTIMRLKISGYDHASNTGAWELMIGAYNYDGGGWYTSPSVSVDGKPPFTSVRLAEDGTNCCILLGTMATVWADVTSIEVSEMMASYWNISGWEKNWKISLLAAETGIVNVTTPVIAYGNADTLNGYSPDSSSKANTIPVRDSNKKIAEVAATRAVSSEVQLTTTSPVVVSTYVAKVSAMYTVLPYLRVMADGKTVTLVVNYTSLSGAKSRVVLPPTLMPINDYDFIPVTLNAQANSTITIVATTNSANGVFVSAILREEG